jgi:hypothetical protein
MSREVGELPLLERVRNGELVPAAEGLHIPHHPPPALAGGGPGLCRRTPAPSLPHTRAHMPPHTHTLHRLARLTRDVLRRVEHSIRNGRSSRLTRPICRRSHRPFSSTCTPLDSPYPIATRGHTHTHTTHSHTTCAQRDTTRGGIGGPPLRRVREALRPMVRDWSMCGSDLSLA